MQLSLRNIGILTAGGDSPGLNVAIRGVGKTAIQQFGMRVVGFRDGFRGLMENRFIELNNDNLSGILTLGGTMLGASRDKPHRMPIAGRKADMTDIMVENFEKHRLDALVCLGGGGTQASAYKLVRKGLRIVTLPKTIDNDVAGTDVSIGFNTALTIATEAIDRLHSTAHSHHRIIVVETMGHNTGWLALGAGLAAGADVILIPEIPYDIETIAEAIRRRSLGGRGFSIVAISEGARPLEHASTAGGGNASGGKGNGHGESLGARSQQVARQLEELTGLESRLTILGHVQRGGTPSPFDRVLATHLGTSCARYVADGVTGSMIGVHGGKVTPVDLADVAGERKTVPLDHHWISAARDTGVELGD
ncbi:MAG: ATP-dependent 6-phosphofructokinase [Chloroflexi bacterium]|nr:ATP-dependent 6-phosphofructokinase [Chloroflexota bacterium]